MRKGCEESVATSALGPLFFCFTDSPPPPTLQTPEGLFRCKAIPRTWRVVVGILLSALQIDDSESCNGDCCDWLCPTLLLS